MGYSTPKKQLDLKEFLSTPGKKNMRRPFGYRSRQETPEVEDTTPIVSDAPATEDAPSKDGKS